MDNTGTAELSAEEAAYFETGGETIPPVVVEPDKPDVLEGPKPLVEEPGLEEDGLLGPDGKSRYVRHGALHAEREEHKKTKAQLEEISRKQAVFEDRWNTLLKLREEQKPQVEPPPDPETDIFGYAKWQKEQFDNLQAKIADQEKQTEQQRQIETQEREIWNAWSQDATAYATEKPEFGDAVKWLSEFRGKQLGAMASIDERFATPAGINAQINAELRSIVVAAKEKGLSPAQVVHNMAVTYGFTPQAPAQQQPNLTMPDKLAGIASAQEAARTVGQGGGRSGGDALTPEAIANMPPAEFERWASDPKNSALLDKMLGA